MQLKLTTAARRDITRITADGIDQFGEVVADRYVDDLFVLLGDLTAFPRLGVQRTPTIRTAPFGAHVVLYREVAEQVVVLRIRHGREDWLRELQRED